MQYSNLFLVRGALWTVGAFGFGVFFRVITNVVLAKLLAPELFGIMVIVNGIRAGIELTSDVGIAQNIVHNPNAETPEFYNTAWTLRLIRSMLLCGFCVVAAAPIARFYETPILISVLPVAGFYFVIGALGSMAPYIAQKRISFVRLNSFDLALTAFSSASHIILAYFIPTVWALVFGVLVVAAAQSALSYLVLPDVRHRFYIVATYARQIFSYGRWVFISSLAYFLSMNFDRLYFGKLVPLALVGVYGIARSLSDLVGSLILRLCNDLVFPLIAASHAKQREQLRSELAMKRFLVVLLAAVVFAALITIADLVIGILYDERYQAAGWMLPLLLIGAWFSMIASLNESTLMGFGKPSYSAAANGLKFLWLLIGFPLGFAKFGILGFIVVLATGDVWRYVAILVGQIRERFLFFKQDLTATLVMFALVGLSEWLRWSLGFGTTFISLLVATAA